MADDRREQRVMAKMIVMAWPNTVNNASGRSMMHRILFEAVRLRLFTFFYFACNVENLGWRKVPCPLDQCVRALA